MHCGVKMGSVRRITMPVRVALGGLGYDHDYVNEGQGGEVRVRKVE